MALRLCLALAALLLPQRLHAGLENPDISPSDTPAPRPSVPVKAVTPQRLPIIEVEESLEPTASATEAVLDHQAVATFPASSSQELLRAVPGLHLSSHGGRGKAAQYFIRGFDAVHGQDLAVSLEGIPLNEVSNIHGQGYLDLHFLPSSLVHGLELVRGVPPVTAGDFAIAAAVDYRLGLEEPGLRFRVGVGSDVSVAPELTWHPAEKPAATFAYAGLEGGMGVGERRTYQAARAGAGVGGRLWGGQARGFLLGYSGRFESPGVLREEDVARGIEDFYGAYPVSGGGHSSRLLGGVRLEWTLGTSLLRGLVYGGLRDLELQHNFTGYLQNQTSGDGRRQVHESVIGGASLEYQRSIPGWRDRGFVSGGLAVRGDAIHQSEQRVDTLGVPWLEVIEARIGQGDVSGWIQALVGVLGKGTIDMGIRLDHLDILLLRWVDDAGQALDEPSRAHASATILSPRGTLSGVPIPSTRVFLSGSRGFRSPAARGIEDGEVAPVTRADTLELGAWSRLGSWVALRAVAFGTWVDNELVFDHAAGRFVGSGSTRRLGGELTGSVRAFEWARAELELSYSDGRYVATGQALPFAPRWLGSVGLYAENVTLTGGKRRHAIPPKLMGGLRIWYLGPRPLPSGFVSHPALVADLKADLSWQKWSVGLGVENLLARHWRDGEFVYASCFDQTQGCSELPVLHITAGSPFAIRGSVTRHF